MSAPDSHDAAQSGADQASATVWILINTHVHKERLALEHLARQGFEAYCPMLRRRIRHARKSHDALRPLFPGYLFVHLDPKQTQWRPILSTVGVRALVRFGDAFATVPPAFVDDLKIREIDGAVAAPQQPYRPGEKVQIGGGAFDGLVATIIAANEKDRIQVLLDMMQRSVRLTVKADQIVPITDRS